MHDRHIALVQAAQTVFARYGIAKTTMHDIARQAGVARQTLYNAYPSKDAVLRATVRHTSDQTLAAVDAAWHRQDTLAEKLETFFQLGPLYWYDLVKTSPEAADLVDGIHAIAQNELIDITKQWTQRICTLIQAEMPAQDQARAADIADFIYSSSLNAKRDAPDRAAVETRLNVLKTAILALLGKSQA